MTSYSVLRPGGTLLPLYHPTTVLLVDDDPVFLNSWRFNYEHRFLCEVSGSPERAIELVRERCAAVLPSEAFLVPPEGPVDAATGEPALRVDASRIAGVAASDRRLDTVSVVIADYTMPRMDGLELCRQLAGLPVKRILLTGKVGEKTAVEGFNAGLIDQFLVKQDPQLPHKLCTQVESLMASYFANWTAPLEQLTQFDDWAFLADQEVARWLAELTGRLDIVEHYVSLAPPGFVMYDAEGEGWRVHVHSVDRQRAILETAREEGAPQDLIKTLMAGRDVAAFKTPSGLYEFGEIGMWRERMLPAQRFGSGLLAAVERLPLAEARAALGIPLATYRTLRAPSQRRQ